ncbi:MAG: histidine phosphatase family protein [Thermoanaerobaculia bacterium]
MDIWLLRHAAAEDRPDSGRDSDRALTPEGIERARAVALGLAALEPGIARVITSPYRRARQTADAAAAALALSKTLAESRALEPESDPQEILRELSAGSGDVLLVGHQPHLGSLLGLLVGGERVEIPMKKAAAARVTLTGRWSGTLRAFLPPRVLEKLGEQK